MVGIWKKRTGDFFFDAANLLFLVLFVLVIAYPLYFTLIASVSNPDLVNTGKVWVLPREVSALAYSEVFKYARVWVGYANSTYYMALGTIINVGVTIGAAFALSRKKLEGRNAMMGFFIFTMYFGGGLIPTFILVKSLGLVDTRWSMLLPGAVSVFNLIIARTFFQETIPEELFEAAYMDGCSDFRLFFKVVAPLSKPIIAVIALYSAVAHWNQYFNALIFLPRARDLHPLQMVLREILIMHEQLSSPTQMGSMTADEMTQLARLAKLAETIKYALIIVASIPLLVIYPFVQKHFVKGVMIGSVKG
jgi:putative aldouronate transport system permease protein